MSLLHVIRESRISAKSLADLWLDILWELVDSLRPPWLRFVGLAFSCIWADCIMQPGTLIDPTNIRMKGMALIFRDDVWAITSIVVAGLCSYSLSQQEKPELRRWTLFCISLYLMIPAVLLMVVNTASPFGQVHLLFASVAFIAFLRPLILYGIKRLKESTSQGS